MSHIFPNNLYQNLDMKTNIQHYIFLFFSEHDIYVPQTSHTKFHIIVGCNREGVLKKNSHDHFDHWKSHRGLEGQNEDGIPFTHIFLTPFCSWRESLCFFLLWGGVGGDGMGFFSRFAAYIQHVTNLKLLVSLKNYG